jgi:hypothetical protein
MAIDGYPLAVCRLQFTQYQIATVRVPYQWFVQLQQTALNNTLKISWRWTSSSLLWVCAPVSQCCHNCLKWSCIQGQLTVNVFYASDELTNSLCEISCIFRWFLWFFMILYTTSNLNIAAACCFCSITTLPHVPPHTTSCRVRCLCCLRLLDQPFYGMHVDRQHVWIVSEVVLTQPFDHIQSHCTSVALDHCTSSTAWPFTIKNNVKTSYTHFDSHHSDFILYILTHDFFKIHNARGNFWPYKRATRQLILFWMLVKSHKTFA